MSTLAGRAPKSSYPELLKLNETGSGLSSTLTAVQDGTGVNSPLELSTTSISLNGATWPTAAGTTGQVLTYGASGVLSWSTLSYAPIASPSFTGIVSSPAYSYAVSALGSISGARTINLANASEFTMTITAATTFTFNNSLASNTGQVVYLRITNGGSSVTWPSTMQFASGTAPTLTASGTDLLGLMWDSTSSSYWLFVIGQAIAV